MFKKVEFTYETKCGDMALLKEELTPIVQQAMLQMFELNDQKIEQDLEVETKITIKDCKKVEDGFVYEILAEVQNITEDAEFTDVIQ